MSYIKTKGGTCDPFPVPLFEVPLHDLGTGIGKCDELRETETSFKWKSLQVEGSTFECDGVHEGQCVCVTSDCGPRRGALLIKCVRCHHQECASVSSVVARRLCQHRRPTRRCT